MCTFLKDDVDRTAHDARISRLFMAAARKMGLGLSGRPELDDLVAEMDKCPALGCFDQLYKVT